MAVSTIWLIFPSPVLPMIARAVPDGVVGMASLARSGFSETLTSRRGARVTIGVVLVVLVALFGLFGGAEAPQRTAHAPVDSESHQVKELLATFPDADVQSVLVVASRADSDSLTEADVESVESLVPVLNASAAAESSEPVVSEDGAAAVIVVPITVGENGTQTAQVNQPIRGVALWYRRQRPGWAGCPGDWRAGLRGGCGLGVRGS